MKRFSLWVLLAALSAAPAIAQLASPEPGEKQTHFLLSSVPLSCNFCMPGGPESMVEVKTRDPVRYTLDPVTVEGKFAVLSDDPYGLYYRVTEAVGVK